MSDSDDAIIEAMAREMAVRRCGDPWPSQINTQHNIHWRENARFALEGLRKSGFQVGADADVNEDAERAVTEQLAPYFFLGEIKGWLIETNSELDMTPREALGSGELELVGREVERVIKRGRLFP